jgi:FixJ family two-component response regulator
MNPIVLWYNDSAARIVTITEAPGTKGLLPIQHAVIRARPGIPMPTRQKIIAVVDDDASMLKSIERLLFAYGFATKVFASAEAFLDLDGPADSDCLLLDIHLGGMSGIQLRRHLSASGCRLPVIFMTAFDDEATRAQAQSAGCTAYLHKPFVENLLIGAIEQAAP